ncbi:MAG: hypothetical protein P8Y80_07545 [Acidobacteriota bacterium]|jgi:hypothetical protein
MLQCIRAHCFAILGVFIIFCSSLGVFAGDVSLAWDPSISEDVVGYKIYYGNFSGSYNSFHTVTNQTSYTVTGLPDGTYYFAVTAFDSAGNESGYSNEVSTVVGDVFTAPSDTTLPEISSVAGSGTTTGGAATSRETDEAATTQGEYGTTAAPADTTPPEISSVASSEITTGGATISWETNEAATIKVEYGTTAGYGSTTPFNPSLQTSHVQTLSGLTINTLYHYRVKSKDAAGNQAVSEDYTFRTLPDTTPPAIGSIVVSGQTGTEATINWTTDEASDSQIEYGTTTAYGGVTSLDSSLLMSHSQVINGLTMGEVYHFRVLSSDEAGNLAVSGDDTFIAMNVASTMTMPLFSEGLVSGNNELYAGMSIMNLGDISANVIFTAFDGKGNKIVGEGITNPAVRRIHAGEQLSLVDVEIFGDILSNYSSNGWIRLESTNNHVRGFFLMFDGQTRLVDGAGFLSGPSRNFVFTDIEDYGRTRISLINRNLKAASLTIDLVNPDGQVRESVAETIAGYGAITVNLNAGLFRGNMPDSSDYVRISASEGVESYQVMQSGSGDISLISAQDMNSAAPVLISPQFVCRKDYRTSISIVNLEPVAGNVRIRLLGKDGVQIGATRNISMNAYGKLFIDDPGFFLDQNLMQTQISDILSEGINQLSGTLSGTSTDVTQNTPSLVFDGYVEIVSHNLRLVGNTSYRGLTSRASFPLVSDLQNALVFNQVASDDVYYTQIAIANTGDSDAVVTLDLYNDAGAYVETASVRISAGQRQSHSLTDYFSTIRGSGLRGGFFTLSSNFPVAAIALFGTRNQSVLSAIPGQPVE